jgi:hypothetical protein
LTEAHHRIKELEETVNIGGDRDRLDSLKQALEDKNQRIMALQTQMAKMSSGRNWNQSSHDLWTQEMELTNKRREADISLERHRLADLEKSREIIQVLQRENIELKDELDRIKISQDSIVDEEVRALKQSNE